MTTHSADQQLVRFFHFLDTRQYERMLDLMTPDAYWLRQGRPLVGRKQAMQVLMSRDPGMRVRHAVSNLVCGEPGLADDTAWHAHAASTASGAGLEAVHASLYLTAYRFDDASGEVPRPWRIRGPHKLSVVHSRLVRTGDGWRIAAQLMLPEFVFDE
jgi:hypothetical protein